LIQEKGSICLALVQEKIDFWVCISQDMCHKS
jgi:hypothetical protein